MSKFVSKFSKAWYSRDVATKAKTMTTFLTPKQAATKFAIHPKTLERKAAKGEIFAQKTKGGHRRYLLESLERSLSMPMPTTGAVDQSELAEMRKRIADLEAQVAEMRQHLQLSESQLVNAQENLENEEEEIEDWDTVVATTTESIAAIETEPQYEEPQYECCHLTDYDPRLCYFEGDDEEWNEMTQIMGFKWLENVGAWDAFIPPFESNIDEYYGYWEKTLLSLPDNAESRIKRYWASNRLVVAKKLKDDKVNEFQAAQARYWEWETRSEGLQLALDKFDKHNKGFGKSKDSDIEELKCYRDEAIAYFAFWTETVEKLDKELDDLNYEIEQLEAILFDPFAINEVFDDE